jgi:hypothetical protein
MDARMRGRFAQRSADFLPCTCGLDFRPAHRDHALRRIYLRRVQPLRQFLPASAVSGRAIVSILESTAQLLIFSAAIFLGAFAVACRFLPAFALLERHPYFFVANLEGLFPVVIIGFIWRLRQGSNLRPAA